MTGSLMITLYCCVYQSKNCERWSVLYILATLWQKLGNYLFFPSFCTLLIIYLFSHQWSLTNVTVK